MRNWRIQREGLSSDRGTKQRIIEKHAERKKDSEKRDQGANQNEGNKKEGKKD